MKLAIKTCTLDMPYEEMLDFCVSQKIAAIEARRTATSTCS